MRPEALFTFAPLESRRFKLNAYRGVIETIDTDEILAAILKNEIDLLIIRVPAENQFEAPLLNGLGMPFIVADTLVYYHADTQTIQPKTYHNQHLSFEEFTSDHFDISDRLVREIFAGYQNNYSTNPVLEADLIEIYQDWARSYATDRSNGKVSWLVGHGDDFWGLITCLVEKNQLEIILNGVLPRESGKGIYGDMIRFVQRFCMENNLSRIKISTQVNNYAVQKVWGREGFYVKNAFLTIHINSLMKTSRIPKKRFDIRITNGQHGQAADMALKANAGLTSTSNGKLRFEKRILLGMVGTGNDPAFFPKVDAVLVKNTVRYLKPVQPGHDYRIEISHPYMNPVKGNYTSLLKLYDDSDEMCLFAYYDFVDR